MRWCVVLQSTNHIRELPSRHVYTVWLRVHEFFYTLKLEECFRLLNPSLNFCIYIFVRLGGAMIEMMQ